jgi:hypothetical protein
VAEGADVIQLSLEFAPPDTGHFGHLSRALERAASEGVRTILPAGHGRGATGSPLLTAPGAVAVVLAGDDGLPHGAASLAPLGSRDALLAPGVDVPGAVLGEHYGRRTGSSFAATFVTAAFASLHTSFPGVSRNAVWHALLHGNRELVPIPLPPSLDAALSHARLRSSEWR